MPTNLLLEGDDLEALLLRAHQEGGAHARIVRAEKTRRGGVLGFFAREGFEVAVEIPELGAGPDNPASARSADDNDTRIDAPIDTPIDTVVAAEAAALDGPGAEPARVAAAGLLGLAERVSAAERAASRAMEQAVGQNGEPGSEPGFAPGFEHETGRHAQVMMSDLPSGPVRASTEKPEFTALLDLLRDGGSRPGRHRPTGPRHRETGLIEPVEPAAASVSAHAAQQVPPPEEPDWRATMPDPVTTEAWLAVLGVPTTDSALPPAASEEAASPLFDSLTEAVSEVSDEMVMLPTEAAVAEALADAARLEAGADRPTPSAERSATIVPQRRRIPMARTSAEGGDIPRRVLRALRSAGSRHDAPAPPVEPAQHGEAFEPESDAFEAAAEAFEAATEAAYQPAPEVAEAAAWAAESPVAVPPADELFDENLVTWTTDVAPQPARAELAPVRRGAIVPTGHQPGSATPDRGQDARLVADREALRELGVPAAWTLRMRAGDRFAAVLDLLSAMPIPRIAADAPVVVVVGPPGVVELEAHRTALDLPLDNGPRQVVTVPARAGVERRAALSAARHTRPVVVAMEIAGYGDAAAIGKTLRSLRPDAVIAVIDAGMPLDEITRWIGALGSVDAVALDGALEVSEPAAVLALDIPVIRLDGIPVDRVGWAALLCAQLAARGGGR